MYDRQWHCVLPMLVYWKVFGSKKNQICWCRTQVSIPVQGSHPSNTTMSTQILSAAMVQNYEISVCENNTYPTRGGTIDQSICSFAQLLRAHQPTNHAYGHDVTNN